MSLIYGYVLLCVYTIHSVYVSLTQTYRVYRVHDERYIIPVPGFNRVLYRRSIMTPPVARLAFFVLKN